MLGVVHSKLGKWIREAAARRLFAEASGALSGRNLYKIRDLGMSRPKFGSYSAGGDS